MTSPRGHEMEEPMEVDTIIDRIGHLEDLLRDAMIGDPFLCGTQWCVTKDAALAGMTLVVKRIAALHRGKVEK